MKTIPEIHRSYLKSELHICENLFGRSTYEFEFYSIPCLEYHGFVMCFFETYVGVKYFNNRFTFKEEGWQNYNLPDWVEILKNLRFGYYSCNNVPSLDEFMVGTKRYPEEYLLYYLDELGNPLVSNQLLKKFNLPVQERLWKQLLEDTEMFVKGEMEV